MRRLMVRAMARLCWLGIVVVVHPRHQPERFAKRRHLIFTFHDTTFECVCDGFDVTLTYGSIAAAVPGMVELLEWRKGRHDIRSAVEGSTRLSSSGPAGGCPRG
jgi:hypothetical protein